jgi:hypothetical protein
VVGFDALAVYVHPTNPVSALSLDELRELWAEDGRLSRSTHFTEWRILLAVR